MFREGKQGGTETCKKKKKGWGREGDAKKQSQQIIEYKAEIRHKQ